MRISTNTIYAASTTRMAEIQAGIVQTQQQISTGRRILSPSDDPIGAARALDITQNQAINTQFSANRQATINSLSIEEVALQSTTALLQEVKTRTISAGSGILSDADRKFMATELRNTMGDLLGQANSTDGSGSYLFGGFKSASEPFAATSNGAQYNGDQGQRFLQVATSRQIAISDAGDSVFQNIPNTSAQITASATANTGNATVSRVSADGSTPFTNHDYDIRFTSATTYDVLDKTLGTTVSSAQNYGTGTPIRFAGQELSISGTPASGDTFTVRTPKNQSIFTTLSNLITALETPIAGAAGKADLQRSLDAANSNFDAALDNVLTVRASIGSRLKELDSLNTSGEDKNFQFADALKNIQDVDYTKAISDFNQQNTNLEAAQKTFVKISSLSLFALL